MTALIAFNLSLFAGAESGMRLVLCEQGFTAHKTLCSFWALAHWETQWETGAMQLQYTRARSPRLQMIHVYLYTDIQPTLEAQDTPHFFFFFCLITGNVWNWMPFTLWRQLSNSAIISLRLLSISQTAVFAIHSSAVVYEHTLLCRCSYSLPPPFFLTEWNISKTLFCFISWLKANLYTLSGCMSSMQP